MEIGRIQVVRPHLRRQLRLVSEAITDWSRSGVLQPGQDTEWRGG